MGFYEDDRIRRKNAHLNRKSDGRRPHTLLIDDVTFDKLLTVLAESGLTADIRDKTLIISDSD